jgi:hypothetical protein
MPCVLVHSSACVCSLSLANDYTMHNLLDMAVNIFDRSE